MRTVENNRWGKTIRSYLFFVQEYTILAMKCMHGLDQRVNTLSLQNHNVKCNSHCPSINRNISSYNIPHLISWNKSSRLINFGDPNMMAVIKIPEKIWNLPSIEVDWPVSLPHVRRVERSEAWRGLGILGGIIRGLLIGHNLDTDWQGRLVLKVDKLTVEKL